MYTWKVKPKFPKAVIEKQYWSKEKKILIYEVGYRGGEFLVYTEEDVQPLLHKGIDLNHSLYKSKLIEIYDACWQNYDFENFDEIDREWVEDFLDFRKVKDLKKFGWECSYLEMIINSQMEIEKVNNE